jgi:hypothetical protein
MRSGYPSLGNRDKEDALICALVASLYANQRLLLWGPLPDVIQSEGWIWVPADVIAD